MINKNTFLLGALVFALTGLDTQGCRMGTDNSFKQKLEKSILINDEEFFSIDEKQRSELLDPVMEVDDTGIAIFAPKTIDLRKHDSIPLILLSATTNIQNWEADLERNLIIAVTDFATGGSYMVPALLRKKRINFEKISAEPKPQGLNAASIGGLCIPFDLKSLLDIRWHDGEYLARAVYSTWVSKDIRFKISNSGAGTAGRRTFSAEELAESGQAGAVVKKAGKGIGDGTFNISLETPDAISLKSPQCPIKGTFQIGMPDYATRRSTGYSQGKDSPSNTITVTMFLVKHNQDQKMPIHYQWNIPVFSTGPVSESDIVEGFFIFDLFKYKDVTLAPRKWYAWTLIGDCISGPEMLDIRQ